MWTPRAAWLYVAIVEPREMSGGRWWWLYVALVAILYVAVVVLLNGSWYWGAIFAFSLVEIGFRGAERIRRRRMQAQL